LTNYPKSITTRYGIPAHRVKSFLIHGILTKACFFLKKYFLSIDFDSALHILFSRWALKQIVKLKIEPDMVCAFSGVAGDIFSYGPLRGKRCLIRASSHICTQYALLSGEQIRSKCSIGIPSPWIIQREQKEYELADLIIVLSTFAYKSFISDGVPAEKIKILSLGTDTTKFLASSNTIESRLHRILSEKKQRAGQLTPEQKKEIQFQ